MNDSAEMVTGWQQIGGKWYYFNTGGDMVTGWLQAEPGKWYYLYEDGSMAANTVIDGNVPGEMSRDSGCRKGICYSGKTWRKAPCLSFSPV